MPTKRWILPVIVFSQFCCTSLWFAGNSIIPELTQAYGLTTQAVGDITSAVQFGFISGTLVFALYTLADRFSPSRVFLFSAMLGAIFNLSVALGTNTYMSILVLRFFTGFFLAGIYPVGMKIAADYYQKGLGKSLGFLVGALVLGTAFPHLIKSFTLDLPWRTVLFITSGIATAGGWFIYLLVPDGPFRKASQKPDVSAWLRVFKKKAFRGAAFGYFGHMWELYTFWAFVPLMLGLYNQGHADSPIAIPFWSFLIIGSGSLACVAGGFISQKFGAKNTAAGALLLSGLCCLSSPWALGLSSDTLFLSFLIFWGLVVIADSPLFSTLVAHSAPAENKATALTIANCIGFSITIVSIQSINYLLTFSKLDNLLFLLALGPLFGLISLYKSQ